ncbi:hypothetical protein IAT40_007511 [Kwoniella sp. CBS 6097]
MSHVTSPDKQGGLTLPVQTALSGLSGQRQHQDPVGIPISSATTHTAYKRRRTENKIEVKSEHRYHEISGFTPVKTEEVEVEVMPDIESIDTQSKGDRSTQPSSSTSPSSSGTTMSRSRRSTTATAVDVEGGANPPDVKHSSLAIHQDNHYNHKSQTQSHSPSVSRSDEWKSRFESVHRDLEIVKKERQALGEVYTKVSVEKFQAEARVKELESQQSETARKLEDTGNEILQMRRTIEEMGTAHQTQMEAQVSEIEAKHRETLRHATEDHAKLKESLQKCRDKLAQSNAKVNKMESRNDATEQSEADQLENKHLGQEKERLEKENQRLRASVEKYEDCFGELYDSDEEEDGDQQALRTNEPLRLAGSQQENGGQPSPAATTPTILPITSGVHHDTQALSPIATLTINAQATATSPSGMSIQTPTVNTSRLPFTHPTLGPVSPYSPSTPLVPAPTTYQPNVNSSLIVVPSNWPRFRAGYSVSVTKILRDLRMNTDDTSFCHPLKRLLKPFEYHQLDLNQRLRWKEIMDSIALSTTGLTVQHVKFISEKLEWGILNRQSTNPIVEPEIIRWSVLHRLVIQEAKKVTPDALLLSTLYKAEYTSYRAIYRSGLPQYARN